MHHKYQMVMLSLCSIISVNISRGGSRKLNEGGSYERYADMSAHAQISRYNLQRATHASPPAHCIAVKAHKSRQKSENDVFKCKLSLKRGGPDPLDPPLYPPLISRFLVNIAHHAPGVSCTPEGTGGKATLVRG